MKQYPHCDPRVLHAPGSCEFCDKNKEDQEERIKNGINFTNTNDPTKTPCPAIAARGQSVNAWYGNRATSGPHPKCATCGRDVTGLTCYKCLNDYVKKNFPDAEVEKLSFKDGTCPQCGHMGEWINLSLVCPTHGRFAG